MTVTSSQEPSPPDAEDTEAGVSARDRLLDAATQEFAALGFAGARVDRIAKAAGANKQLIYHHYRDKKGLYLAALTRAARRIRSWRQDQSADEPYLDRMLSVVRSLQTADGRAWVRLVLFEGLETEQGEHPARDHRNEPERQGAYDENVRRVALAQTTGEIDPEFDPDLIPLAMLGLSMLPMIMPQWVRLARDVDPVGEAFLADWERFVAGVYRHLAARTPPPSSEP